ncbi:hypothetical protein ASJ34_17200 [Xanthomonas campestris pv. campestris]|nr:hypothetical protein ASJ34_17200 [Xanthomonas campestris pv. campestris]
MLRILAKSLVFLFSVNIMRCLLMKTKKQWTDGRFIAAFIVKLMMMGSLTFFQLGAGLKLTKTL